MCKSFYNCNVSVLVTFCLVFHYISSPSAHLIPSNKHTQTHILQRLLTLMVGQQIEKVMKFILLYAPYPDWPVCGNEGLSCCRAGQTWKRISNAPPPVALQVLSPYICKSTTWITAWLSTHIAGTVNHVNLSACVYWLHSLAKDMSKISPLNKWTVLKRLCWLRSQRIQTVTMILVSESHQWKHAKMEILLKSTTQIKTVHLIQPDWTVTVTYWIVHVTVSFKWHLRHIFLNFLLNPLMHNMGQ